MIDPARGVDERGTVAISGRHVVPCVTETQGRSSQRTIDTLWAWMGFAAVKLLHLGMTLQEVVRATTVAPAAAVRRAADVTVLELVVGE